MIIFHYWHYISITPEEMHEWAYPFVIMKGFTLSVITLFSLRSALSDIDAAMLAFSCYCLHNVSVLFVLLPIYLCPNISSAIRDTYTVTWISFPYGSPWCFYWKEAGGGASCMQVSVLFLLLIAAYIVVFCEDSSCCTWQNFKKFI